MQKLSSVLALSFLMFFFNACGLLADETSKTPATDAEDIVIGESHPSVCDNSAEQLTYATTGVSVAVTQTTTTFDFTAEQLKANADECGATDHDHQFNSLFSQFSGTKKTTYYFKYTGASQGSNTFVVTILPNIGYQAMEEFKHDFDQCYAGGDAYPSLMNVHWLLFESSCGSGFDDGSGLPNGCDEVKKVVAPSLQLNNLCKKGC